MVNKDNVKKQGKWEFDGEVANVFSDMLSRSIPNYDTMRLLCYRVGRNFIPDGGVVGDIGCSNGLAVKEFVENFPKASFYLNDISEPMLDACRGIYLGYDNVYVSSKDLREGLPFDKANLVISCLTLQFTPIEYRQNILGNIYDSLERGGALVIVEKVLGNSAEIDNIFVDEYYNIKKDNGYTQELIAAKRKSLEGVLVPITAHFNEELLRIVGFKKIDCFWRCLNFAGWVAIK